MLTLDITGKHFKQIVSYLPYLYLPLTLPFCTIFSGLDLGRVSHGQHKAKPLGFIFSHTFQLNEIKFGMIIKQFKLNVLGLLLSEN